MSDNISNSKRIAKNTLMLYIRMLFTMGVSLFTSRVVLQTLGVEDYGIYNVVGGIVSMLVFFNSSVATSTQRFLNHEMGKGGDGSNLQRIFSNAINAHLIIGVLTVILLETGGLWFLYNKLNIPQEQFHAAVWVFHFSVLSLFVSIIMTPYNAAIIANEKMGIYAYYSIFEVSFRLIIVYILTQLPYNKLILYGFLSLCVSVLMCLLYFVYCKRHFSECVYKWNWDRTQITSLFSFSGWMLFGCLSDMLSKQGVNILINMFFGPMFNAARAVAVQVQYAVNNFVANFMTAVRPQIIKSYSAGEYNYMYRLVFSASKLSFYLLFVLTVPILLYTEYIFDLWLDIVPEYSVLFTRLVLIELLISSAYVPIAQINQASGRIRNYQIAISVIFLLNFVLSYILYKLGFPVYSTFIVSIGLSIVGLFVRVIILKIDNNFPAKHYILKIMLPLLPIALLAMAVPYLLCHWMPINLLTIVLNSVVGVLCSCLVIWCLGLDKTEKGFIKGKISAIITKVRK